MEFELSGRQQRRGLVTEVARVSKLPYETVRRVMRGLTTNPTVRTARAIEAALAQLKGGQGKTKAFPKVGRKPAKTTARRPTQ